MDRVSGKKTLGGSNNENPLQVRFSMPKQRDIHVLPEPSLPYITSTSLLWYLLKSSMQLLRNQGFVLPWGVQLKIFPAEIQTENIDFLRKPAWKIVNDDYMFVRHLRTSHKCEWIVRCPHDGRIVVQCFAMVRIALRPFLRPVISWELPVWNLYSVI